MRSVTLNLVTRAFAGAALLGVTASSIQADLFTWDNSCGDSKWSTCCELWEGGEHLAENNWAVGSSPWPNCPPFPESDDDVDVGSHFIILDNGAYVNSFASSGILQLEHQQLSAVVDAIYDGSVHWYGGGFGYGTHYVNGDLDAMGSENMYVRYGTLNQAGTTTWTGTGEIYIDFGAVFNNLAGATFDVQNDSTFQYRAYGSTFNNFGTFAKTGGAGITRVNMGTTFNNSGLIDIQVGTFQLDGPGSSSGTFNMAAGATVDFHGVHTLRDGASITGAGFATGSVRILDGDTVTAENFEIHTSGGFSGYGTVIVTDTLAWTGGIMMDGTTRIDDTATLNISGADTKQLRFARGLDNAGSATWTGTGDIQLDYGGTFNNLYGATFDVQSDAAFRNVAYGGTFNNLGTFIKSGGAGTTRVETNTTFNNSGLVDIQIGTLQIDGGGTSNGTFNIAAGAVVDFRGVHTLHDGVSITGAGFATGAITIPDQETVTAENLEFHLGDGVSGYGTLIVTDTLNWTGGTVKDGTTHIEDTAALNISGADTKQLRFAGGIDNAGSATWTGTGDILLDYGGTFNNLAGATFDVQNDATIQNHAYRGTFNNAGTFVKSGGSGTTYVDMETNFNNSGLVDLQTGIFDVDGVYTQTAGTTLLRGGGLSGRYTIDIQGGTLAGFGTVDGTLRCAGEISPGVSAGTINITGNYQQFADGVLTIELAGSTPGEFDVLNVAGTATLNGTLNVTLLDGYLPGHGDMFAILTGNGVSGTFASVNLPALPDKFVWSVSYESARVILMVRARLQPLQLSR